MVLFLTSSVQIQGPRACQPSVKPPCSISLFLPCRNRSKRQTYLQAVQQGQQDTSTSEQPWRFGFQMNERWLVWDDAAAAQLIKLHIANKLHITVDEVEGRLNQLARLIPDMVDKLPKMRADILLELVKDPAATTRQLMGLRDLLPGVNISLLVTRWPFIMLDYDLHSLERRLQEMREQLPGVRVEALVDLEPQLLKVDLNTVLANIRRIMPGRDPVDILVAQPQMVLDMQQAGLGSALDVEGFTPADDNA